MSTVDVLRIGKVSRMMLPSLSAEQIAQACGVHITTARRWLRDDSTPFVYRLALALVVDGDLGTITQTWSGWSLRNGALVSPDGWTFSPGEVAALPIRHQQIAALERELRTPTQRELPLAARALHLPVAPERDADDAGGDE